MSFLIKLQQKLTIFTKCTLQATLKLGKYHIYVAQFSLQSLKGTISSITGFFGFAL